MKYLPMLDGKIAAARRLKALWLLGLGLTGCAGLGADDLRVAPTSTIRSTETGREPSYPPVGVRPPAPAPDFTSAERERVRTELEAARERNRAAASTPLSRPLPR